MSEKAKKLIKSYEGCSLKAYKCPAGVVTIAWGRTKNVKMGDTCTQEQADKWFDEEYASFESKVRSLVKVPLNENQLGSLTSFAYNCGVGNLQKSTLLKKLNNKDYKGAADEFLKWNKAGGKELVGLTKRRKAERELFLSQETTKSELPYKVVATTNLNIRKEPNTNSEIVLTVPKGTTLTVWAIETVGKTKWGKNEKGFFSLSYCDKLI